MRQVQAVVLARGMPRTELLTAVSTLARLVSGVVVAGATTDQWKHLDPQVKKAVPGPLERQEGPVLVTSGQVAFAWGSLRRLRSIGEVERRAVVRVYVPGLPPEECPAWWSPEFLANEGWAFSDVISAGLQSDREYLDATSPRARAWVHADEVGIAAAGLVVGGPLWWAFRVGTCLEFRIVWRRIRAHFGRLRRALSLWRQRRCVDAQSVR